jgi:hypothetical protein
MESSAHAESENRITCLSNTCEHDLVRTLEPAPTTIAFGSFRGALPAIRWDGSPVSRALRGKRWVWLGATSDDVWISLAILRAGYAANVLGYVYDRRTRRMIFEKTVVGPPTATVTDDVHRSGIVARAGALRFERSGPDLRVFGRYGGLDCDFYLDDSHTPPGIAAMSELGFGLKSATEKRIAAVRGSASVDGRSFDLDGAVGGWDYTNGLLPRHTKWCWAFGVARDVGFNLVEGFVGAAECAVFADGEVRPLMEPRFTFDRKRPTDPWRIEGEGIHLRFEVGAVHAQHTNLLVVRSNFLQPVGTFYGEIGGVKVDGMPGVVEDQDVVW